MTTKNFRLPVELAQTLRQSRTFTHTNTSNATENAVLLGMEEGVKVSFVVDQADAYVNFDADAEATDGDSNGIIDSMLVPAGTGYFEAQIYISTRISIINATAGQNARIRGVVWGR
jgi:hypothetical protein